MKYFLKGFHRVIPAHIMSMISWRYCEIRAMGERTIDISVLRKYTSDNREWNEDNRKWFWEVMEDMEEDDKKLYLKFVNGRSKMPSDMSQVRYKHTICYQGGGDNKLPQAHVCYF